MGGHGPEVRATTEEEPMSRETRGARAGAAAGTEGASITRTTVLCALDDSPASRDVVRVASRMHHELGARLVLLQVAEGYGGEGMESVSDRLARSGAERALDELAGEAGLASAVRRVEVGDGAPIVARAAEDEGARLILVGARRSRLRGFRSDLARRLAAETDCPVLVVPPGGCGEASPGAV
jgi:nucleotide-binding universal stress UspA family protein